MKTTEHDSIIRLREIVTSKGCEHIGNSFIELDSFFLVLVSFTLADRELPKDSLQSSETDNNSDSNNTLERCGHLYLVFDYLEVTRTNIFIFSSYKRAFDLPERPQWANRRKNEI